MSSARDPGQLISEFLEIGPVDLPDRSYDAVRAEIEHTRQRVVIGPWREEQMIRYARFALAAAAVVLIAVVGIQFLPTGGGIGNQPTPTATPAPAPTVAPIADPSGRLQPGVTYVAHPFDTLLGVDARGFTFTVPSANWEAAGDPGRTIGVESTNSDGVGLGFLKVHSLNSDACHWTTDDDIAIGTDEERPTVDQLVTALPELTTVDSVEGPYTEQVSNVSGQGFELTMPATLQDPVVDCDEQAYRIWNAEGFDIYAQGPSNTWRLGIFDVGGEPYIVIASDMPDTPNEVRNELMSIFRSVVIDSSPGCPKYSHECN